tara:strand:+ start:45 stop:236 length:192 start_codon:yes stop_codon:yes gene_type:complete
MSKRGYPVTVRVRDERRKQAELRQAQYNKLSLKEKLERLPAEPQASRQRLKLLKQLEGSKDKV